MKTKRLVASILVVCFAAALSLSLVFTVRNLGHACSDSGVCAVCASLEIAEEISGGDPSAASASPTAPAPLVRWGCCPPCLYDADVTDATPVSLDDLLTI